ncbi:glycosyltransferase [Nocardiopsis composta]|uniref:Glycosyltransferase n=2 Tax=Nocardiopsis composta TaxID=157465 RepID=A0A7W8QSZ7_9ACTN|nr:glycosyltransferase [Nocardiopsis composta]MBB5436025.1 hypothetical protein [Nocardiopsis composta]
MLSQCHSGSPEGGSRTGRRAPSSRTRVFRNDWTALVPPEPASWRPELAVSVVVPAFPGDRLELTLAALSVQTYPAHLLDVVVVAPQGLRLPISGEMLPGRLHVERAPAHAGPARARAAGARAASGEVICWLDAGTLVDPFFVEVHARWHHLRPECVTFADLLEARRIPDGPADAVALAMSGGMVDALGAAGASPPRDALLEATADLAEANEDGHRAFTSAATAVRRTLYEGIGGPDTKDDPELGRRLWHAGALFVPDRDAPAWRTASPGRDGVDPWSDAGRPGGRGAVQPLVRAVIDVEGAPYDMVRACVDRLLDGTESDLDVALAADWDAREEPGGDPMDLRLLQAAYLTDPRVGFTARPPGTGFPAPFVLRLPVVWGVAPDTLAVMVARAERARAGLVELIPDPRGGNDAGVRLWRTRALLRGMRDRREEEGLAEAVESVYGRYRIQCGPGALTDLTDPEARRYRSAALRAKPPVPPPAPPADTGPPGGRGRPAGGEEPPACTAPPPPGGR